MSSGPALPLGWATAQLDDLFASVTDGDHQPPPQAPTGVPFIVIGNIRDGAIDRSDGRFVRTAYYEALPDRKKPARGDLLYTVTGSFGIPVVVSSDERFCVQRHIAILKPLHTTNVRYVALALSTIAALRQATKIATGTAQKTVGLARLRSMTVPLAPTGEQQRIVDTLDSLLPRLDAAVASLEAAQRRLKAYRVSVLKAAVEGRLVPTEAELARAEGRSFEPADVLLERILKERRRSWEVAELAKTKATGKTPTDGRWKVKYHAPAPIGSRDLPDLPAGWCWTRLSALLSEPLRNGHSARATKDSDGVRTLTLSAVTQANFGLHNTKLTSAAPAKVSDLWLRSGDIFVERSNTPELVGLAALYRGPDDLAIFPDLLIRVRCHSTVIPEFLEAVLSSSRVRRYFRGAAKGIAGSMPKISQETIENVIVPLPPTVEQQSIVNELERLHSCADAIERGVTADRLRCRRLRQGVLTWAFEGQLVDRTFGDEPADALLVRTRAERAAAPSAQPKQKRSRQLKATS